MKETSFGASEIRAVSAKLGTSGGCKDDPVFTEKFRILGFLLKRKNGIEDEEDKLLLNLRLLSISKALLPIF